MDTKDDFDFVKGVRNNLAVKVNEISSEPEENTMQLTPYDRVREEFSLPYEFFPFQQNAVNVLAPHDYAGLYFEVGLGKTAVSTAIYLFKYLSGVVNRSVVIMPPILINGWKKALEAIPELRGQVELYRGTPLQRKAIPLGQKQFTLVGSQIFKKDFNRFNSTFGPGTYVIVDEADMLKNVASDNHKKIAQFSIGKQLALLTATPLSTPEDAYAYIKLLAPGIYRSKAAFMNVHVEERDFFGNVSKWQNLDMIEEAMKIRAERILKRDVMKELPPVSYTPLPYELDLSHKRLYKKLAEEQLLLLEGGGKLDATSSPKLYHSLGQIIMNHSYFSGDPDAKSAGFEVLDQLIHELDGKKLIVFANYKMTIAALTRHFGAKAVYVNGTNTPNQNQNNLEKFKTDPDCKIAVLQPSAAGKGVDGLHLVCCDAIFMELPCLTLFTQAVGRLDRIGQTSPINIRIAIAEGTLQVAQKNRLLANDELVNSMVRGIGDLRKLIYGEEEETTEPHSSGDGKASHVNEDEEQTEPA